MTIAAPPLVEVDYPCSDDMGDHETQFFIRLLLVGLVQRLMREQGRVAHVAGDQFFYWVPGDETRRRAPDLYVIEGLSQDTPDTGSWLTWQGHVPQFALEIASKSNWKKDYRDLPADYDAIGVEEFVIFDPGATVRSRKRLPWQVYRRRGGRLVQVAIAKDVRALRSEVLDAWLVPVAEEAGVRLRIAEDERGERLLPTEAEAERAAKEAALAEVAALRAELARLKGDRT